MNGSAEPPAVGAAPGHGLGRVRLLTVMTALMMALFLQALDQTMVGTAMPRIVASLNGFDRYAWVVTAYLLGTTMFLPIAGRLSDMFGRKGFVVSGIALFVVGAVLSGLSRTMDQLIVCRMLQGIAAGIGITLVFTVVADLFEPRERARWQAFFATVFAVASVAGPTLGGWLADHGPLIDRLVVETTRWRWVFFIYVPLGLVPLTLLWTLMPAHLSQRVTAERGWAGFRRIDFVGAAASAGVTVLLMLPLTWVAVDPAGWGSPRAIAGLTAAGALLVLLVRHERRTHAEPMLPMALFSDPAYRALSTMGVLVGMIMMSLVIYAPLYLQGVAGWSASGSGLAMLPLTVGAVASAIVCSRIIAVHGRYRTIARIGGVGLFLAAAGMTQMTAATSHLVVALLLLVAGMGFGIFNPVVVVVTQAVLPRSMMGVGMNAVGYGRSVGQMLGVAIVATTVQSSLGTGNAILNDVRAGARPEGLQSALQHGFTAIAIFAVVLAVVAFLAKEVSIFERDRLAAQQAGSAS